MPWWRHMATIGADEKPLHAGIPKKIIRQNVLNLMANGPADVGHQIENDVGSVRNSGLSLAYASVTVLWRDAHSYLRYQYRNSIPRGVRVYAELRTTGAAVGTVRLVGSPEFKLPNDDIWTTAAADPDVEDEVTPIGNAWDWYEFKIPAAETTTSASVQGSTRADRAAIVYRVIYLFMQGKADPYSDTVELRRLLVGEYT